jgi:hypothetical protein
MAGKNKAARELWTTEPAEDDFASAHDYLTLLMGADPARRAVNALRAAATTQRKAKDVLRASRLPLLPRDDADVAADLKRIKRHEQLSPVLLVRGDWVARAQPMEIADGYHRVCAGVHAAENAEISCRIADLTLM